MPDRVRVELAELRADPVRPRVGRHADCAVRVLPSSAHVAHEEVAFREADPVQGMTPARLRASPSECLPDLLRGLFVVHTSY